MAIMNWVWPITALYAGPLAVWGYYAWGKASAKPFAAGVAVDATHCGAGCTLGDIVGESLIFVTSVSISRAIAAWRFPRLRGFAGTLGMTKG